MTQNGTNGKRKQLTAKQRKMAETLMNPDFNGTVTQLCKEMNVPRRTYYNWLDNPAFCEYMASLVEKYANSELASVWKSLITECKNGNVKAIKLYFERIDKASNGTQPNNVLDKIVEAFKNV